jgi:hypothetical protein
LGRALATLAAMLFTAKCFWPGATETEIRHAVERAGSGNQRTEAVLRGALYLPRDELVLCLFDSESREGVKRASERAGLPCERVIETVWVEPIDRKGERCPKEG